ncbi:hypothetical protein SAMN04488508_10732 [Aquimarina spongiae]|uniref:Uncharacterized protein n=2 Tax=Aquimarina spongiae TaxID=570521 RepID=A0A1M6I0B6_9FLAO|nr:hypothetical protein SAMN04488508_10732 [Aquimarina spongiae]
MILKIKLTYNTMRKIISSLIFILTINVFGQNIEIDATLITEKTFLKTSGYIFESVTAEVFKNDTIKLVFIRPTMSKAFIINLADKITPEIILRSDYPSFGKKYSSSIPLESFKLKFNKAKYKLGDTLMARVECVSKPFKKYTGNPKFKYSGEIMHIIQH